MKDYRIIYIIVFNKFNIFYLFISMFYLLISSLSSTSQKRKMGKVTKYEVQIRVQDTEQNEEIILDMKDVTVNLLKKFYDANKGRKPEKIIMFRDGVSEGQFLKVGSSQQLLNKS